MIDALAALVRDVGARLLTWRADGGTAGAWDGTQFHAAADRWAHDALVSGLTAIAPQFSIVSEEAAEHATPTSRYWLIDPIDGTASYAGGFEGFVTQVALIEDGAPVLAAVCAPAFEHVFLAERGRGATRNGVPLRTRDTGSLTLIDNTPTPHGLTARVSSALSATGYRESGSLGLKICRVADGTADLFVKDVRVRDWDLAPAHLLLEEAGGVLSDGSGAPIFYGRPDRVHAGLIAARDRALGARACAAITTLSAS